MMESKKSRLLPQVSLSAGSPDDDDDGTMSRIFCCPHQKENSLHRVTDKLSVGANCSQLKISETKEHAEEN